MRNTPARRARAAAVLTTAVALGGLSLAAAPAANAVVLDPLSTTAAQVGFYDNPLAPTTCTQSGAGANSAPLPLVADGLPHTVSVSSSGTATNDGDATDVTTATATATRTVTVSQAGGQLSHINVRDSFSATMSSTKGAAQKCNLNASAGSIAQLQFDLVKPTYVSVSATAHGMITQAIVATQPGGAEWHLQRVVDRSRRRQARHRPGSSPAPRRHLLHRGEHRPGRCPGAHRSQR